MDDGQCANECPLSNSWNPALLKIRLVIYMPKHSVQALLKSLLGKKTFVKHSDFSRSGIDRFYLL